MCGQDLERRILNPFGTLGNACEGNVVVVVHGVTEARIVRHCSVLAEPEAGLNDAGINGTRCRGDLPVKTFGKFRKLIDSDGGGVFRSCHGLTLQHI